MALFLYKFDEQRSFSGRQKRNEDPVYGIFQLPCKNAIRSF